jgi:ATP-dependent DNA helicase RecG
MLADELLALATQVIKQKCESNHLEIKAAKTSCPKIYDTLSSFSNQSDGGIIIFGIDESSGFEICGVYDPADLQRKIGEQCLQMEPVLRPLSTVAEIGGKIIVAIEIQEIGIYQRPCFYKGSGRIKGSYVRVGDADRQMTEYEIYSYEAYRKKIQDELRVVDRATLDDIKTAFFDEYLLKLKKIKPNLASLPNEKQLKLQGFAVDNHPTLAGVLMFSDYPQAFCPQLCITAVVVPGVEIGDTSADGTRFIDNLRIDGTIPEMLKQALQFVRRNGSIRTIIDPDTGIRQDKPEYPVTAVREIILNALIHRDYSIHTDSAPISLVMYHNRLELENPGGLYGRLTIDTLGTVSSDTRNPFIAGAMEVLGETENRYSGIPAIRKAMAQQQLPPPVFEVVQGAFRVTLYNDRFFDFVDTSRSIQDEILAFCMIPRSRKELYKRFNSLTPIYLATRYINPLVKEGRLLLSIPEKPKSKSQKFMTKSC